MILKYNFLFYFFTICFLYENVTAQEKGMVFGTISDSTGNPISSVNIAIVGKAGGTVSDSTGYFSLKIPANEPIRIAFSFVGYNTEFISVRVAPGEKKEIKIKLNALSSVLAAVNIQDERERLTTLVRIDPKVVEMVPNPSGSFEAILKTLPGVSSANELSSQYSVRGGNYDENLVYVNDVEIYRPFLVRSGQQEGLSFINSDLVSSILFSAGGFEAIYGDKMSSALDIRYRKPRAFAGSASASLLGGAFHLENMSKNTLWSYLIGARYKTGRYILGSLDTDGDYNPSFADVQACITRDLSEKTELSFLGNYSRNNYNFIPQSRNTEFGTINQALRFTVYFDGQEIDAFETWMGATTLSTRPNKNLHLKFISSAFRTFESERFDIMGQYWLDELERDLGDPKFGDVAFNRGVGTYLIHARNYLDAFVTNAEHKGSFKWNAHYLQWGTRAQHEVIHDRIREWTMIDSSDYSLPQNRDTLDPQLILKETIITKINLSSNRYNIYVQDNWSVHDSSRLKLTAGIRASYWDLNEEWLVSPRASISFKPQWTKDYLFRFSTGYYFQPPFYRELRDPQGRLNKNIRSQKSIHLVLGADHNLKIWSRPFKYVAEIYYKHLEDLIPYKIDNVRIRYLPGMISHGYATGIDMRINGEFVQGVESWVSLSLLRTQEDIEGDYYYDYFNQSGEKIIPGYTFDQIAADSTRHEPGYIPRPTDQLVNFGLFFQDYLPSNPNFKMHLTLLFGSGLPFGPPGFDKFKDVLRMPPYRRVDIGFSAQLLGEHPKKKPSFPVVKKLKSAWVSLEVFNLLGVNNTVSYLWVKDVTDRQYAVPNYLTARRINGRLIVKF